MKGSRAKDQGSRIQLRVQSPLFLLVGCQKTSMEVGRAQDDRVDNQHVTGWHGRLINQDKSRRLELAKMASNEVRCGGGCL